METLEYWKRRCKTVENRMDQLENEILRLKGLRRMTPDEIDKHNKECLDKN